MDKTDGTNGLYGAFVGRGWDGWTLAPARTGDPPLDLEGSRCAGWLLPTWDGWGGWTAWGVGGTGVGRMGVSTCRNGSATLGAGIGAPPLAVERRWDM